MGNIFKKSKLPKIKKEELMPPIGRFKLSRRYPIDKLQSRILKRRIAPFFQAHDDEVAASEKCAICFMYYVGGLNSCKNCDGRLCTECYVRCNKVRRRMYREDMKNSKCPYCTTRPFKVDFSGPLSTTQRDEMFVEQQRVIHLDIKRRESLRLVEESEEGANLKEDLKKFAEDEKSIFGEQANPQPRNTGDQGNEGNNVVVSPNVQNSPNLDQNQQNIENDDVIDLSQVVASVNVETNEENPSTHENQGEEKQLTEQEVLEFAQNIEENAENLDENMDVEKYQEMMFQLALQKSLAEI